MALPNLLSPLAIGPVLLRNRIVSSSHQTTLVHEHLPTDEFVAYQAARAAGETGLIVLEAVAVAPSGLLTAHTLGGYLEPIVDGYRRVAAAVQGHGCRLFVQLFHGGREQIASAPRAPAVSSSALPSARFHTEPRALRTDEVVELVASYGRCASLAAAAGLDGIEVTAAHGYLGEQFFRPEYNLRSDRYAESSRFVVEVLRAVRDAAPGLALGVRLSADSEAARAIAPELAPLVDYVHVAVGNSATFDGCTQIAPPPPTPQDLIGELTEPFKLGPPLIATTRVVQPAHADALIGAGVADAFGMTRALITDPEMPRKVRTGDGDRVLRCIGCNACIAHYHAETPIRCSMNPRTGRELTLPAPTRVANADVRRVVVVGAGPAGLAAAAEAAAGGHEVVLLERRPTIGGQVTIAGASPAHAEQALALAANYTSLLSGVDLRFGVDACVETVLALSPELVVIATGARPAPVRHALDGIEVAQAWDVLDGSVRPSGRVIVSDWGGDPAALDCAELLAAAGCEVTLAVGAVMPGETVHQYARNQYLGRLARAGVTIADRHGLVSASGGEVEFANVFAPELRGCLRADWLVLSHGRVPEDALEEQLRAQALPCELVAAGDCRSPRGLEEAILEGTLAARDGLTALAVTSPDAGTLSNMASAQQTVELWDDAVAQRVVAHVEAGPTAGTTPIVCASGISPSGQIHLGNLREVFTTHLVAEALRRHGHEVVHLHSWDDYDRFRKVPAGVDPSFERYVGMPLASIPDPLGQLPSYADRYMDQFRAELEVLGIRMIERRQSELYPVGTYNAAIRRAMDERERVFDTLAEQQTAGRHETSLLERRRAYYPFKPYCTECFRDDTRVLSWDGVVAEWECRHGHAGSMSLADGVRISGKLVWKVDWPMRWAHEGVSFEPAGEDHHAPTGSFTVGRTLVSDLYGGRAPESIVYSFVTLAGVGGKMSGSAGGVAVASTAFEVIEPAIVRWLYVRRLPSQSFAIDLSPKGVQRLYDEWDRLAADVHGADPEPADVAIYRESTESSAGPVQRTQRPVSFRLLASVADITQGDLTQMARIVSAHLDETVDDSSALLADLQPRLDCAIRYATELVPPQQRTRVRTAFSLDTFAALDERERRGVTLLAGGLADNWSLEGLTGLIYAVPKQLLGLPADADADAEVKAQQRTFYKAVYRLLCDAETGPRLPTLLLSIGRERAHRLLVGT